MKMKVQIVQLQNNYDSKDKTRETGRRLINNTQIWDRNHKVDLPGTYRKLHKKT